MARLKAKSDFVDFLSTAEKTLLSGNLKDVRRQIGRYARRKLAREQRLPLAQLARRAGYPALSLRLLNPIVKPRANRVEVTAPQEQAEYAASLVSYGSVGEAMKLLRQLPAGAVKETPLYLSYALFTQWNYREPIPLLETFLRTPKLTEGQKVIGKLNLVACFVHEQDVGSAVLLLKELEAKTHSEKWQRFLGNTLELKAQLAILEKDWRLAEKALEQARKLLRHEGLDALFVEKWGAVLALSQSPSSKTALNRLLAIRKNAERIKHWETIRDCDAWQALIRKDEVVFQHVYFGTPYPAYREMLLSRMGKKISLPESYDWLVGNKSTKKRVDFFPDGTTRDLDLKPGARVQRLAQALVSDFYRPQRLAGVFSALHESEFFHPQSSPTRLHQSLKYFRQWLKASGIPLALEETDGNYRLIPIKGGCRIWIPKDVAEQSVPVKYLALSKTAGTAPFSSQDAARWLSLPHRTAQRFLRKAVSDGIIATQSSGPATRYRFR